MRTHDIISLAINCILVVLSGKPPCINHCVY